MITPINFMDQKERLRFVAEALMRFDAAGEAPPFEEDERGRSTADDHFAEPSLSLAQVALVSLVFVALSVAIGVEFGAGAGAICVALSIAIPPAALALDRALVKIRRASADGALSRAGITRSQFEILHEIHERIPEDYRAGERQADLEAAVRRIEKLR